MEKNIEKPAYRAATKVIYSIVNFYGKYKRMNFRTFKSITEARRRIKRFLLYVYHTMKTELIRLNSNLDEYKVTINEKEKDCNWNIEKKSNKTNEPQPSLKSTKEEVKALDAKFCLLNGEVGFKANIVAPPTSFLEEEIPYANAIKKFIAEINEREHLQHKIDCWMPVHKNGVGWLDFSKVAIKSNNHEYICKVYYKCDTKDGSPRITKLEASDFCLYSTANRGLTYKQKLSSISEMLNKDSIIGYCEMVFNACVQEERGVFNALLALNISEKEWKERFSGKQEEKAWIEALSIRFGEENQKAIVTKLEKVALFAIELPKINIS